MQKSNVWNNIHWVDLRVEWKYRESELEDRSIEFIQPEKKIEKKKSTEPWVSVVQYQKVYQTYNWESPKYKDTWGKNGLKLPTFTMI